MRLTISETFKEIKIKDFKFPVNAIIGVIIRGHRVLIPNGDTVISPGDRLKIFTMKEDSETIKKLFYLFSKNHFFALMKIPFLGGQCARRKIFFSKLQ